MADIAQQILLGKQSLVQLIEQLGPKLTNEDPFERAKGLATLTNVLEQLDSNPSKALASEIPFLIGFYCDRLKDQQSVADALKGLLILVRSPNFQGEHATRVAKTIFDELAVQTYVQTTRMLIFRLLTALLSAHMDAIRSEMGRDFVVGYIQAMDGEKDPRNLLMAFRLANVVARQFPDIEPVAEELFEVTSCYFPITFKPPPGDPYGITSDDLKKELKRCIVASPHFTSFAIPLLMDKLASSSRAARRDALDVLADGMSVYGGLALEPQTEKLWKAVKEVLFDGDTENEETALRFLTKFLEEMSKLRGITVQQHEQQDGSTQKEVVLHLVVDRILKDISSYWMEEEASLRSKAAVRILVAAVKSGDLIANTVVHQVLPAWIERYHMAGSKKSFLLDSIYQLLVAVNPEGASHPFTLHKDEYLELVTSALRESELANVALQILGEAMMQKNLLYQDELELAMENLQHSLLTRPNEEVARILVRLTDVHPELVRPVVEELMETIVGSITQNRLIPRELLQTLEKLCVCTPFAADIIAFFCKVALDSQAAGMLDAIVSATKMAPLSAQSNVAKHLESFISTWMAEMTGGKLAVAELTSFAKICATFMRMLDASEQSRFLMQVFNPQLRQDQMNPEQRTVMAAFFNNIRPSCSLFENSQQLEGAFLTQLARLPFTGSVDADYPGQMLASFMNKSKAALPEIVDATVEGISTGDMASLSHGIWLTKALVMRGDAKGYELTERLLDCFQSERKELATMASEGFSTIVAENPDVLSKECFAVQKLLYRQRFFHEIIPRLESRFQKAGKENKHYYLVALSHILRHTPKKVLLGEMKSLLPLLFHSFTFPNQTMLLNTLATFQTLLQDAPQLLAGHAGFLIKSLLNLVQPDASMHVRKASLQALTLVATLPYDVLYPHRALVTRSLLKTLDDPKRLVRKEAALCRNKWFLLVSR